MIRNHSESKRVRSVCVGNIRQKPQQQCLYAPCDQWLAVLRGPGNQDIDPASHMTLVESSQVATLAARSVIRMPRIGIESTRTLIAG